jgi:hypothetical protein
MGDGCGQVHELTKIFQNLGLGSTRQVSKFPSGTTFVESGEFLDDVADSKHQWPFFDLKSDWSWCGNFLPSNAG